MTGPDLATRYVLGSLSPLERSAVEQQRLYDRALDAAIEQLEAQMAPLAAAAGEEPAPPGVFARVMATIDATGAAQRATVRLPFAEGAWQVYAPGIEQKFLWDEHTFLLRCAPGAIIPPHGHDLDEHLVVVSGDLFIDGVAFAPGDYHTMPRGTRHDDAMTRMGCVLLIQSRLS